MKNEYVREVSNLKKRIKRYRKEFIQEKEEEKDKEVVRNYGLNKQLNNVEIDYNNYKNLIKKYNKGEISEQQVRLAEEKLENRINEYKSYFSRSNKKNIDYQELYNQDDEILRLRIGSVKNINSINDSESVYKKVSDIINRAIERKNKKENTNDSFITPQEIYDNIFGGAIDSPYYDDIKAHIAEKRTEFRQSILKQLKDGNYLTSTDETNINDLISI